MRGKEASPATPDGLPVALDGVILHNSDSVGDISKPLPVPPKPGSGSQPISDASVPDGLPQPIPDRSIPDDVPQPIPDAPMLDGVSQPIPGVSILDDVTPQPIADAQIPSGVTSVAMGLVAVEEMKYHDVVEAQPAKEHVGSKVDHGTENPQMVQVVGITDSPKGRRKMALQRSCSVNDLDNLGCEEESPQTKPQPQKSSNEVTKLLPATVCCR